MELLFVSPDVINAWDKSGLVTAWNVSTGRNLGELQCLNEVQIDADISADGRLIAAACNQVFLAEVEDVPQAGEFLHNMAANDLGETIGVAFNPDASLLAIAGSAGSVAPWDVATGQEQIKLAGPQAALDQTMRQGSRRGYGTAYLTERGERPLGGVDISPDGRYLATASADGTINVYILPLEDLVEAIRSRLSRGFTDAECQTYLKLPECPKE